MLTWRQNIFQFFSIHFVSGAVASIIKEHQDTFNEDDIRDFIDAFLVQINRRTDETYTVLSYFLT